MAFTIQKSRTEFGFVVSRILLCVIMSLLLSMPMMLSIMTASIPVASRVLLFWPIVPTVTLVTTIVLAIFLMLLLYFSLFVSASRTAMRPRLPRTLLLVYLRLRFRGLTNRLFLSWVRFRLLLLLLF